MTSRRGSILHAVRGRTLVVIPTYNETENAGRLVAELLALPLALDVLVVDDASPDGTADLVVRGFAGDPRVRVRRRAGPRCYAQSLLDGHRCARRDGYDAAVQMDADFSHPPAAVPELVAAARRTGADVVIGSRYVAGGEIPAWPLRRRLLSGAGNTYLRLCGALAVHDVTSGFRLYRRAALERIGIDDVVSRGFCVQAELTLRARRAGLRVVELPIRFADRCRGASKLSAAMVAESLLLPWRRLAPPPPGTSPSR